MSWGAGGEVGGGGGVFLKLHLCKLLCCYIITTTVQGVDGTKENVYHRVL